MAVITISRDMGSMACEVGQMLSKNLGYRFVDYMDILARLRAAGHKWEKWAEGFDEHTPGVWEKYDWSFHGFVAQVQNTIMEEAVADRVIIMGRGGNYLLKNIPFVLRLRIVAPFEARIARTVERESIDRESARWLIERTDRERAGFLLTVYGRNGKDPLDYDLVFDSGTIPIEEIAAAAAAILSDKDRRKDEKSMRDLKMRALAARVKAHLFTSLPFFIFALEVVFEGEAVCLRGVLRLPSEREFVISEARKAAGDAPIRSELKYRQ